MKKPRIVIDARMLGGHGIGVYVEDMARSFLRENLWFSPVFLVSSQLGKESSARAFETKISEIPFLHPREAVSLASEIHSLKPDLFHTPSFSSLLRYPCGHVQTIHDLNHLQFGNFIQRGYYRTILLPSLKKAAAIATVSESSKVEILLWLGRLGVKKQVSVIPNAIFIPALPELEDHELLEKFHLKKGQYFFTAATKKAHKNLITLLEAYGLARNIRKDLAPLVVSEKTNQEGVTFVGKNNTVTHYRLVKNAKALFFPSLYEGFGRPPLEAVMLSTPAVASDISVNRETSQGISSVTFLPAKDVRAWSESFLTLDSKNKTPVPEKEKEHIASKFSLESLREKTFELYRSAIESTQT